MIPSTWKIYNIQSKNQVKYFLNKGSILLKKWVFISRWKYKNSTKLKRNLKLKIRQS